VSTTTHIPVEVYLRSSYEPDAEYVDGEIEERPMGSTTILHGRKRFASGSGNTREIGMPQDGTYYCYEERQLLRKDSFSHAAKGIFFAMDRIKEQLD